MIEDLHLDKILIPADSLNKQEQIIDPKFEVLVDAHNLLSNSKDFSTITDHQHLFYKLPKYYDLAFMRDTEGEIDFYIRCFQRYSEIQVTQVIEAACGPGLFLEMIAKRGYNILGFDLNPAMVEYAKNRLRERGISSVKADAIIGNMSNFGFEQKFDAAFVCINSLGYLTSNHDIISHFKSMNTVLNQGAIYIVEISCRCNDINNERKVDETWHIKEDQVEIDLKWAIKGYDIDKRLRIVDFKMSVNDNGKQIVIEEEHELRLWIFEEFREFIRLGGFEIVGIFNQNYDFISDQEQITGELGVLYFV
ncbi:MAG: class I SAM-dependent methyltransferase, partial [Candidatus Thorarchaeota archaeon]